LFKKTFNFFNVLILTGRYIFNIFRYKTKFDFPFVICVRENKFPTILRAIEQRLQNDKDQELNTGIEEVKKISTLRIQEIVKH